MRQNLVKLAVILCVATPSSSAYAHHSHPYFYDECKSTPEFFSDWTTERPIPLIGPGCAD